eukprot:TRINITY_DN10932_c0_g1_i1.p1 TRINITY_DN10932_c0_g1~~TRINITY_DN10932_c0_g1_i1.p1  ORF type:complete len:104 (-),score=48.49 TRINITY_DN10932_c0_g1_i1:73-384(-)
MCGFVLRVGGVMRTLFAFFFFNDPATTEIYTRSIVGSVRCVQETGYQRRVHGEGWGQEAKQYDLSLIHISEPTRPLYISYAVFCLKKKKKTNQQNNETSWIQK